MVLRAVSTERVGLAAVAELPALPVPATVRILPDRSTTTQGAVPAAFQDVNVPPSTATALGSTSGADRASAPSTGTPFLPLPAMLKTIVFRSMRGFADCPGRRGTSARPRRSAMQ